VNNRSPELLTEAVDTTQAEPRASDGPLIRLNSVDLTYGVPGSPQAVEALREVSFDVGNEQFVSILGPSGCGKSTLLKIVAGLLDPTRGSVTVDGHSTAEARRQRAVSFVFQTPVLLPWRTVLDNVALLLEVQGTPRQERLATARRFIELVGLRGFESHRPRQLSGGMQQRVSIARALSFGPSILLMDEPFGALDAITRDRMAFELLGIWRRSRKTVLFVTHSVSEAVLLSDVVVVMTPRPGQVKSIYTIDLPRPRTPETRVAPRFVEFSAQLLHELEDDLAEPLEEVV
jgi:NitT/TauT family transport system ATP-binding protein